MTTFHPCQPSCALGASRREQLVSLQAPQLHPSHKETCMSTSPLATLTAQAKALPHRLAKAGHLATWNPACRYRELREKGATS